MNLDELNLRNPVHIAYYDPFGAYDHVADTLKSKFPLTNIHWKHHPLRPVKSIPLLPVEMTEEVPRTNTPQNTSDPVYLRLMFVSIDNLDVYRSQVRPLIRAWLLSLVIPSGVEWCIILFIPSSGKDKQLSLIKTSSFDKLKLDFGADGKELVLLGTNVDVEDDDFDRCVKIKQNYENNIAQLEAYTDLVANIKTLLLRSFNSRFHKVDDVLRTQSLAVEKFLANLLLASLYGDMRLFQDALDVYGELGRTLKDLKLLVRFSGEVVVPKSFENYSFEKSFDPKSFHHAWHTGEKVSLLDAKAYVFINQSVLLQLLANFASSISILSLYISKLFQLLIPFLNDISSMTDSLLDEWFFVIVENYLNLPICKKLLEVNANSESLSLGEIYEFKGELVLLQKSNLVKLAENKGYVLLGVLQDVLLSEKPPVEVTYPPLKKALSSADEYYNAFEKLTELAIQEFLHTERTKTIDVLSIDLAVLNYRREKYEGALKILQYLYEFFIENGWKYMGGVLLGIYFECMEKVHPEDHQHLFDASIKLLCNLAAQNTIGISDKNDQTLLYDKMMKYAPGEVVTFPVETFFRVSVAPFLMLDPESYRYYVELEVENAFAIDFAPIGIELTLTSALDDDVTVVFSPTSPKISKKSNTIKLYTNDFRAGEFYVSSLTIRLSDTVVLEQDFGPSSADSIKYLQNLILTDSVISPSLAQNDTMVFLQHLDQLHCEFASPDEVELGKNVVVLKIHNGSIPVTNIKSVVLPLSDGLSVEKATVNVESLAAKSTHVILIPYTNEGKGSIIELQATVMFETKDAKFSHQIHQKVDTTLSVSVSVQDFFKADSIFSRFLVGTSNAKLPIRVISTELSSCNKNLKMSPSRKMEVVAFGEQPASFVYKIVPLPGYKIQASDKLDLYIKYSNLRDECCKVLETNIEFFLRQKNLVEYYFLLRVLVAKVVFDLNSYAIYGTISVENQTELLGETNNLLQKVRADKRAELKLFLTELLGGKISGSAESVPRQLYIAVTVPVVSVLHIVGFEYEKKQQYPVGEPIEVKIRVKSSTRWTGEGENGDISILAESSPHRKEKVENDKQFQLTVQNDENWLVSGLKRQNFEVDYANTDTTNEFRMVLIPLNVGKLLLPRLLIKAAHIQESVESTFENGLETVLVVPDLESITFSF